MSMDQNEELSPPTRPTDGTSPPRLDDIGIGIAATHNGAEAEAVLSEFPVRHGVVSQTNEPHTTKIGALSRAREYCQC